MNQDNLFKIMQYIDRNPMATLSTVNEDGTPHGAIVYVCGLSNATVCFITKNLTQKYINLTERPAVSLTIGNVNESSTLQISGQAGVVEDPRLLDAAMKKIGEVHAIRANWLPPLAKLQAGEYAVIGVSVTHARLGEFQGTGASGAYVFTEI